MDSLPLRPQPPRPFGEAVVAWLKWFGLARMVVVAAAVLAIGAGGFWLMRAPSAALESTLPYATKSSSPPDATTTSAQPMAATSTLVAQFMVVHVAGSVAAPGVYELPGGSRLHQAIQAAGGLLSDADPDVLNLAALLHDGDRVFVPRVGEQVPTIVLPSSGVGALSSTGVGSSLPAQPVDLNRATVAELDALPGVGPSTAAAIVAHREQNGPFGSIDDLLQVRGIGPAKIDALRGLVAT